MKKVLILVFSFVFISNLIAHSEDSVFVFPPEDNWVNTDSLGILLKDFLYSELDFPNTIPDDSIKGRMIVSFTIMENGKTSNCKIVKGISHYLDIIVLRKLRLFDLKRAAVYENNGKTHAIDYTVPILFNIPSRFSVPYNKP
ncbi:MAG: energy transducer TonB [Bacteroidales bacterium]|nr:energy transducer TonB [Bacteroidales bacterium]